MLKNKNQNCAVAHSIEKLFDRVLRELWQEDYSSFGESAKRKGNK